MDDGDWTELSRQAGVASHRLVGWISWDPVGIENYAALGVPDGIGYYIATRGAPLGDAGNAVVTAAYYSIHPDFVAASLDLCREHTTFAAAARARDEAVVAGLRQYVPEICDDLAAMAEPLWVAADALTPAGRPLYAAHQDWPRPDDPLLSAWLAVNCIREWRGDTHWAIHVAEDIDADDPGGRDRRTQLDARRPGPSGLSSAARRRGPVEPALGHRGFDGGDQRLRVAVTGLEGVGVQQQHRPLIGLRRHVRVGGIEVDQ